MWPALHDEPCVLSIRFCSGAVELTVPSVTNASWFAPKAVVHSMEFVPVAGASMFVLIEKLEVWSIQLAPIAPLARLKLSSTAVCGNAAAAAAVVNDQV